MDRQDNKKPLKVEKTTWQYGPTRQQEATESGENNRGSMDRQDNKKPLKVEKTTVVVWTDKTTRSH